MCVVAGGGTLGPVPRSTSPWWPVVGLTYAVLTEGPEAALQYLTIYSFIIIINIVVVVVITTTTTIIIIITICPLLDPPTSPLSLMNKFIINIAIVATITN